jgi:hypothetical protein
MMSQIAVVLVLLAATSGQANQVIDLTEVVPRNRTREPATVSASGGESGGDKRVSRGENSLSIEILSAQIADQAAGSYLQFEVLVRNISKGSVGLPIDPNLADFEPGRAEISYSYLSANFFVTMQEANQPLQAISLYGSREVSGTLIDLSSGESIEIRAQATLKPLNRNTTTKGSHHLSVRAGLLLLRNSVTPRGKELHQDSEQVFPQLSSANTVTIALGSVVQN